MVVLQALLVPLFAGPAANLAPRDLPLAVAGPQAQAREVAARLEAARPGAFDVRVIGADAADQAIRDREVYGAIVLGAQGASLHIASAASPTVATLLTQAVAQLQPSAQVVDVVPTDADDPRGAAFGAGFLPLAITGMLAGVAAFFFVRGGWARALALGTFGVLAGLGGALVLRTWLGVIPGDYVGDAAALGLFALALSAAVAGLGALLGRAGLGLGAVLFFLVGNALSAVNAAPELLAQPWGTVGQFLPIGAGVQVLRSDAYFDGVGAGRALVVLSAYAIVGLILVVVRRGERVRG